MLACESALRLGFDLTSYFGIIKIISTVLFSICLVLSYISFIDYIVHFAAVLKKED
jgi:CDP-diacylglycerol--glycerol-3-phosphate 3-phosphatidyltransferase